MGHRATTKIYVGIEFESSESSDSEGIGTIQELLEKLHHEEREELTSSTEFVIDGITLEKIYCYDDPVGFGCVIHESDWDSIDEINLLELSEKSKEITPKVARIFRDKRIRCTPKTLIASDYR